MPGPVPKRSEERLRRNKDVVEIEKVQAVGEVAIPDLLVKNPHPITVGLWEAAKEAATVKYYEATDWAYLNFILHFADQQLKSRASGPVLATITSGFTELLFSEGARRRLRIEIEREKAAAEVVDISKVIEERLRSQGA